MKIFVVFGPIVFFLLIMSCSGNREKSSGEFNRDKFISKVMNAEYLNSKSIFSDEQLSHFPASLGSDYITHTESVSPKIGIVRLDLTIRLTSFDSIQGLLNSSVAIYNSTDTCLLVANRFATKENYYPIVMPEESDNKIDLECYKNLYPVPSFWQSDYTINSTECKLKEGFKIYVIDSKPGIYAEEKYLSLNPYLPKKWEHGFSKGIAVSESEKVAIYWVIVW